MDRGYIKLWRKIQDWCWYKDANTTHFFNYILMKASYKEVMLHGIKLERGQLIFGRHKASEDTGLSHRSIRTAITRLKTTSEMTIKSTNRFSIITILNYDSYQSNEEKNDQQNDQQNDKQTTSKRPANDHIQEVKHLRTKENIVSNGKPDSIETVFEFMKDSLMASNFWDYYQSNGWRVGKNPMKDWKCAASRWVRMNSKEIVNAKREPKPFPKE